MSGLVYIAVHPGAFPEQAKRDLIDSLRFRQIAPKFLYTSHNQAQKWLALHEAHSPARTDPDCLGVYDQAFSGAAKLAEASPIHVLGLGCGGGQKDVALLRCLQGLGRQATYAPCDVSLDLVLTALGQAQTSLPGLLCHPMVCDLGRADDWNEFLDPMADSAASRLICFFGMMPNFEPDFVLPRLFRLVRDNDFLLISANLSPGPDYAAGVQKILPGYDNRLTRDWLMAFLTELGVPESAGDIHFTVETTGAGLMRIVADYEFAAGWTVRVWEEAFEFKKGDRLRLFFSYRYTPRLLSGALAAHGLTVVDQWLAKSGEEGVFLCRKSK